MNSFFFRIFSSVAILKFKTEEDGDTAYSDILRDLSSKSEVDVRHPLPNLTKQCSIGNAFVILFTRNSLQFVTDSAMIS